MIRLPYHHSRDVAAIRSVSADMVKQIKKFYQKLDDDTLIEIWKPIDMSDPKYSSFLDINGNAFFDINGVPFQGMD